MNALSGIYIVLILVQIEMLVFYNGIEHKK
jgi:hypothetical protein